MLILISAATLCATPSPADDPVFAAPVRVAVAGGRVATDAPGYAAPALHDVTGDGTKDLVVGQFDGGKIAVYPGKGDGTFGEREWLRAGGEIATVPGVW
ncbi:MAG: VCBS repeat-containing protein [Planctomycetota bacterium]